MNGEEIWRLGDGLQLDFLCVKGREKGWVSACGNVISQFFKV